MRNAAWLDVELSDPDGRVTDARVEEPLATRVGCELLVEAPSAAAAFLLAGSLGRLRRQGSLGGWRLASGRQALQRLSGWRAWSTLSGEDVAGGVRLPLRHR